jgi:hypothetical protein
MLVAAACMTRAAAADITGVVVTIDSGDLVLDLGAEQGIREGQVVEIWRPLTLRHPVTGKRIADRFKIGTLVIGQVRPSIALATPSDDLSREAQAGDVIVVRGAGAPPTSPPAPGRAPVVLAPPAPHEGSPKPGGPAPASDPEAAALAAMFDGLRGATLSVRIRAYEEYTRSRPRSRFAPVLYEEAQALRAIYAGAKRGDGGENARTGPPPPRLRGFVPPEEVRANEPLRVAVELADASGAVLHARLPGEGTFVSTPMTAVGAGYFAAQVPAAKVTGTELELFIEGTDASGAATPVVGTPDTPTTVSVRPPPRPRAPEDRRSSVFVLTDYASYNRLEGNDVAWQTEGYFGQRFGDEGVRALRTGFGVYRGVGGTLEELDERGLDGRKVGLTYGYLETELGVVPSFAFVARAVVGLLDDGVSGGGQLQVRIGSDLATNLVLGGELLGGIGLRSFAQLELNTFRRFPIVLRSEVTNQPAGAGPSEDDVGPNIAQGDGEIGARGIAQLGFRIVPQLVVAARGSFQGRTINHAGPGAGLGVGYEW